MNAAELTIELIGISSITGDEKNILLRLEKHCTELGLEIERQPVSANRWNLFAGWRDSNSVVFCTHVDTVPPFLPCRIEGSLIYGRGACDTKGIIAAMLIAGKELLEEGHKPAFLFVVGEETDSIGAKTAASSNKVAEYIIVGEPTDNMLVAGHKGVLSYTLTVSGEAAHSAYPERGTSAIHVLLDVLQRIRSTRWGKHPVLGDSTMNIGLIQGGTAMNILAPTAQATVIHRIVEDPERQKLRLKEIVGDDAEIHFHSIAEPQLLTLVSGFESKTVNYGTDIPYLKSMGSCLLFGPGSIHVAHTDHEHIDIRAIEVAIAMYKKLFYRLNHVV